MSLGCTCLVSGSSFRKKPLKPPLLWTGLTMMLIQEALKQHWENVGGGGKLQPFCTVGRAGWRVVPGWMGRWGWGDTAHAQLSSAHTHTDLRQENGSSLNFIILEMNPSTLNLGCRYWGWAGLWGLEVWRVSFTELPSLLRVRAVKGGRNTCSDTIPV